MNKVMVALITPFKSDNSIDYLALDNLIERLIQEGCDGFIVCGTTAETPTLTHDERIQVLHHVIQVVNTRVPLYYGCGTNATKSSIEAIQEVEHLCLQGVLLVTPYYNRPTQEGLFQHFKTIAKSVNCPIMLYDIPSRTSSCLHYDTIRRLICECPNIVALKYASTDFEMIKKIKEEFPNFYIYSGEDAYIDESADALMDGLISVMAHLVLPKIKIFLDEDRIDNCTRKEINKMAYYTFIEASPAPIKYMLSKRGECNNIVRLPLVTCSMHAQEKIDAYMTKNNMF
ncbi:MAG: 4-hydroxy-tetrahydrodipicolinate synthase [Longicatena sp.]